MSSHFNEIEAALALTSLATGEQNYSHVWTPQTSNRESDLPHPILDTFYNINRDTTIHPMTNFSKKEFFGISTVVQDAVARKFTIGRGQNYCIASISLLFITLTFLKSGISWRFCAIQFKLPCSTFQGLVWTMIETIFENNYDHSIVSVAERTNMKERAKANCQFEHRPYACYATDVRC